MSTASSLTQHGKDLRYCPNTGARVVTLADFEVGQQLGKGITGSVFVARDRRTNAVVALKRLNIAEIARQNMGVQIERELAIIQKLDHPNILKMFTYFTDKEHLYLVIEYAVRGDLWQRLLQQGSFSLEMTAMLVSQLADAILALDYAFPATPVMPDEAYDLIKNLLRVDPRKRLTLEQLQEHPFIVKYYRKKKAAKQATSADRLG
eukprot:gene4435-6872_t